MNFSPLPVLMLMAGIVLIYSAVKDVKPTDVVKNALKGKPTAGAPAGVKPPSSGFDPGAGAGGGGGGGGGSSW